MVITLCLQANKLYNILINKRILIYKVEQKFVVLNLLQAIIKTIIKKN